MKGCRWFDTLPETMLARYPSAEVVQVIMRRIVDSRGKHLFDGFGYSRHCFFRVLRLGTAYPMTVHRRRDDSLSVYARKVKKPRLRVLDVVTR